MQDRISESIKSWSWDVVSQSSGERMSNVKIGSGSILVDGTENQGISYIPEE